MFRYYILLLFIFQVSWSFADDLDLDTIRLEEITIHGDYYQKFSPGSTLKRSDSIDKVAFQPCTLSELIGFRNPVYFKSYGNGMLSTISFRGTGASHTAVIWNGVNINQPTIGQSDFSLFPVLAFDEIQVIYGSTSSRFGSDAIGGGILLGSKADWHNTLSASLGQYAGSYRNFMTTLKLQGKVGKNVFLSSKFYRHQDENDFEFVNITKPGKPVERQENASVFQYGLLQDLYVNISGNSQLSVKGWFNFSDREIQPTMVRDNANERQKDKNLRLVADYDIQSKLGYFEIKGSYLWDYLLYSNTSEIITAQHIGQFSYENNIGNWEFRFGTSFNHIKAEVENYNDNTSENRTDIYGGIVNNSLNKLQLSLNFRQTFVPGFKAPFSPSLGIKYDILQVNHSTLFLTGQAALNYRVPTMNDRYWVPGGRIDLKPENSRNLDASLGYHFRGTFQVETAVSTYYYNVDNWIMWVPGAIYWVPENVRQVDAYGFDLSANLRLKTGQLQSELSGNYGLSRSVIKTSVNEDDIGIGNQLPYTPVHITGAEYRGIVRGWLGELSMTYTGKRYVTADNESVMPSYFLVNLRVGKNFRIARQILNIDFRVNNIFNVSYQNMNFRAMPGRNYMIGINFMYNKK